MINSVDILLAHSFEKYIAKNLGNRTTLSLKNRLNEKYGKSLSEIVRNDMSLFEDVLVELVGQPGAKAVIKNAIQNVCNNPKPMNSIFKKIFKSKNNNDEEVSLISKKHIIEINDDDFKARLLESYNDDQKASILNIASENPLTTKAISEKITGFDKNIIFEKIQELITVGLLVPLAENTYERNMYDKDTKYYNIVKSINVTMNDNKLNVCIIITDETTDSVLINSFN